MKILMKELQLPPYQMLSGQYEAQIRKYHSYKGKSGRVWLVADQENAAENVYVSDDNPNSQGFGGASLVFPLVDGGEIKLKGPWHANADALFSDTGVDFRDLYYTTCYISLNVRHEGHKTILLDVIHHEPEPVLGPYERARQLGKKIANELKQPVYVAQQSEGGGSYGFEHPSDWSRDFINSYWNERRAR